MLADKQLNGRGEGLTTDTATNGAPEAARQETEPAARLRMALGKLSRRLRSTQAGAGLSPSQISVLFTIARRGPIGLSALAAIEGINPTMLSRITAQLGEQGLIRRSASAEDRRAAVVEATAAGKRLRERIHRERNRALERHLARLNADEQRLLWQALPALEQLAESLAGERR
jgi:DNA-binding MarR family transcriptional regulator